MYKVPVTKKVPFAPAALSWSTMLFSYCQGPSSNVRAMVLGLTQFWITLPAEGPARGSKREKVFEVKGPDGWAEIRGRRKARRAVGECMMSFGRNAGKRQVDFKNKKLRFKKLSTYNLELLLYPP